MPFRTRVIQKRSADSAGFEDENREKISRSNLALDDDLFSLNAVLDYFQGKRYTTFDNLTYVLISFPILVEFARRASVYEFSLFCEWLNAQLIQCDLFFSAYIQDSDQVVSHPFHFAGISEKNFAKLLDFFSHRRIHERYQGGFRFSFAGLRLDTAEQISAAQRVLLTIMVDATPRSVFDFQLPDSVFLGVKGADELKLAVMEALPKLLSRQGKMLEDLVIGYTEDVLSDASGLLASLNKMSLAEYELYVDKMVSCFASRDLFDVLLTKMFQLRENSEDIEDMQERERGLSLLLVQQIFGVSNWKVLAEYGSEHDLVNGFRPTYFLNQLMDAVQPMVAELLSVPVMDADKEASSVSTESIGGCSLSPRLSPR